MALNTHLADRGGLDQRATSNLMELDRICRSTRGKLVSSYQRRLEAQRNTEHYINVIFQCVSLINLQNKSKILFLLSQ